MNTSYNIIEHHRTHHEHIIELELLFKKIAKGIAKDISKVKKGPKNNNTITLE